MKSIAVVFATRDGHTRKVAEHVAARLRARGQAVELRDVEDLLDDFILERSSAVVLAASVHGDRHEERMIELVKKHRDRLERIPSAFLSVSLKVAGAEREDVSRTKRREARAAVVRLIDRFWEETGWRADLVKAVGGALVYTRHGTISRLVMKQKAKDDSGETDISRDYEYTDWSGLDRFVDTFLGILGSASRVKAETVSIATFIPAPRLTEVDHVDVDAPASLAYQLVHHFDLARSPLIRSLLRLQTGSDQGSVCLDEIGLDENGFQLLAEEPGTSFIVGAVGRFWDKDSTFASFTPDEFASFDAPGWGKVAWSIRVEPLSTERSRIHVEVRVTATDDESWACFKSYWRLMGRFSRVIRREALRMIAHDLHPTQTLGDVAEGIVGAIGMMLAMMTPMLRRRRARWGVDAETAKRVLPGDEWIEDPRWQWTHGIEIDAPPERVWPWIAQIGRDRAGFYSYQFLENVAGSRIQNAERVHAEWSTPKKGDALQLHPHVPPIPIVAVEPGRWFLAQAASEDDVAVSWLFFLEPLDQGKRTRFISRHRISYPKKRSLEYGPSLVEPISFVMDRRMLIGVKERAERG